MVLMEDLMLYNGVKLPQIGLGTYPLQGEAMDIAIDTALLCGYRLFDTAYGYNNDDSLGNSLKKYLPKYGLKRDDVIITTKIGDKMNHGRPLGVFFYNAESSANKNTEIIVNEQIESAFKHLQTDYIDLLLIHHPYPDYFIEIWHCLERALQAGKVRAIGVSNYRERHLKQLIKGCLIKPMINQFEHHPLNTEKSLIAFCKDNGIQIEAYSPLLVMNKRLMNSELFLRLSEKYSKTVPQIILRWNIQLGIIPIPKSGNPVRIKENNEIFDFTLNNDEVDLINALNEDYKSIVESIYCPGY